MAVKTRMTVEDEEDAASTRDEDAEKGKKEG